MDVFVPRATEAWTFVDGLPDPGTWQQSRVTHWHLWRDETATGALDRFEPERIRDKVLNHPNKIVHAPREALHWLVTQQCDLVAHSSDPERVARMRGWHSRQDWEARVLTSWDTLTRGLPMPSGFGLQVSAGQSVMVYADPMTPAECSRPH